MGKVKKVVIDIDGVLADEETKGAVYSQEAGWCYDKCIPLPNGIELVRRIKAMGCHVTLYTARWEKNRPETEAWLKRYDVPYDVLRMDKPSGSIYIDDRGFRWNEPHGKLQAEEVMCLLAPKLED